MRDRSRGKLNGHRAGVVEGQGEWGKGDNGLLSCGRVKISMDIPTPGTMNKTSAPQIMMNAMSPRSNLERKDRDKHAKPLSGTYGSYSLAHIHGQRLAHTS